MSDIKDVLDIFKALKEIQEQVDSGDLTEDIIKERINRIPKRVWKDLEDAGKNHSRIYHQFARSSKKPEPYYAKFNKNK